MARSLAEILASRKNLYDPQRSLVNQQLSALPGQQQAELAGLDVAKDNSFRDITNDAVSRGGLYSGMPVNEQARYLGSTYLPARAQVSNTYASNAAKLQAALLGVNQDEANTANDIRTQEMAIDTENAKTAAATRAAQGNSLASVLASMMGGQPSQATAVDATAAARGFAKQAKQQLLAAGSNQPFAREAVLQDIMNQFGLDPKTAQSIIYREIFPDNWSGGTLPAAQQQSLAATLGFGQKGPLKSGYQF